MMDEEKEERRGGKGKTILMLRKMKHSDMFSSQFIK